MRRGLQIGVTVLFWLGGVAPGTGSLQAQGLQVSAGAGAGFESFTFTAADTLGVRRLSLLTLPFGVRFQPTPQVRLELNGAAARGTLTRADGTTATISGATDTQLRGLVTVVPGAITLSLDALLPTGRSRQSGAESEAAGWIASELLPLRISNWGSGGGVGVGAIVAVPVEGWGVGLNAGYMLAREFQPLEGEVGEWRYRPGNTLRIQLGVDRTLNRSTKATLLLGLQQHAHDEVAGASVRENVYRPGSRYQAIGSLAYAVGRRASAISYLGVQHRRAGSFIQDSLAVPVQDPIGRAGTSAQDSFAVPAQSLILLGTQFRLPVRGAVLLPGIDARLFRRADGRNQGYLGGLGAAAEWALGGAQLVPNVRSWFGKLTFWDGAEGSVWGIDLGMTVRAGGQRP